MSRPVTLFTGQWADLPLAELLPKVKDMGYDGVELACWGDHFDVQKAALNEEGYVEGRWELSQANTTSPALPFPITILSAKQSAINIDERHAAILSPAHLRRWRP